MTNWSHHFLNTWPCKAHDQTGHKHMTMVIYFWPMVKKPLLTMVTFLWPWSFISWSYIRMDGHIYMKYFTMVIFFRVMFLLAIFFLVVEVVPKISDRIFLIKFIQISNNFGYRWLSNLLIWPCIWKSGHLYIHIYVTMVIYLLVK